MLMTSSSHCSELTVALRAQHVRIIGSNRIYRSQWSSGSMPACGVRDARIELTVCSCVYHDIHYHVQQYFGHGLHPYCSA